MKKYTITAVEQDKCDIRTISLQLETDDDNLDIKQAVRNACAEYIKMPVGQVILKHNAGCFNWADFAIYVSNEICKKHGFTKFEADESHIVSWEEQLIDS